MVRRTIPALLGALTCVLLASPASHAHDFQRHTLLVQTHDGDTGAPIVQPRHFWLHVPHGPAPQGGYPVILGFHGGGHTGRVMIDRWDVPGFQDRFVLAFPNALASEDRRWQQHRAITTLPPPDNDVDFVKAIIAELGTHPGIDTSHVYASGFSSGGGFTWELMTRPDTNRLFRGFGPVSKTLGFQREDVAIGHAAYHRAAPKPLIYLHGTADDNWQDGGLVTARPDWRFSNPHTALALWLRLYGLDQVAPAEHVYPDNPAVQDFTVAVRQTYAGVPGRDPAVASITILGGGHSWPDPDTNPGRRSHCKDIQAAEEIVRFWEVFADLR